MNTARSRGGRSRGRAVRYPQPGYSSARLVLGARLRRLREAAGVSCEDASQAIRGSASKISRLELGRTGFKIRDVADLLTLYGVDDKAERATMLALATHANATNWWQEYADVVPGWLEQYLELEPAASLIRTYQVQVIPGLLQTEVYARAVVRLGRPDAPQAEVERRVELRMARQHILCREEPTRLWAVIDEASLRRPVGGPAVMRAQVQHLIEASRLPHVNLQVLPLGAGGHGACGGSISMLRFSQDELPDVVYLEHLFTAVYLNKPVDTANYRDTLDRLVAEAEPPGGGWHSGTGRGGPRGQVTQEVVAPSRWTLGGRCPRATASVIAAMDPFIRVRSGVGDGGDAVGEQLGADLGQVGRGRNAAGPPIRRIRPRGSSRALPGVLPEDLVADLGRLAAIFSVAATGLTGALSHCSGRAWWPGD